MAKGDAKALIAEARSCCVDLAMVAGRAIDAPDATRAVAANAREKILRLADALEAAAKEPTREHYRERLNSLISALCDERCDAELMDGGWRVRNRDSERLDYILPLLELADGDGNAVATRIGGAMLLGLTGRAAIDAAREGKP